MADREAEAMDTSVDVIAAAEQLEVATFTKWMVGDGPAMAGTVGGSVGEGSYSGQVLDYRAGERQLIEARYEFNGSKRAFAALVHVEQTGLEAVISGVVTDGWGKGRAVRGTYDEVTCEHDGVTTACWRGTLAVASDGDS
jgi:hypothetical protein